MSFVIGSIALYAKLTSRSCNNPQLCLRCTEYFSLQDALTNMADNYKVVKLFDRPNKNYNMPAITCSRYEFNEPY